MRGAESKADARGLVCESYGSRRGACGRAKGKLAPGSHQNVNSPTVHNIKKGLKRCFKIGLVSNAIFPRRKTEE